MKAAHSAARKASSTRTGRNHGVGPVSSRQADHQKWLRTSPAVFDHLKSPKTQLSIPSVLKNSDQLNLGEALVASREALVETASQTVKDPEISVFLEVMRYPEVVEGFRWGLVPGVGGGLFSGLLGGMAGLIGGAVGGPVAGLIGGVFGAWGGGMASVIWDKSSSGSWGGGLSGLGIGISCAIGATLGTWEIGALGSLVSFMTGLLIVCGVPALKGLPDIRAKKQKEQAQYEDLQAKKNEAQAYLDELDQFVERMLESDQLQDLLSEDLSLYRAYYDEAVRGELNRIKGEVESQMGQLKLKLAKRRSLLVEREKDQNKDEHLLASLRMSIGLFEGKISDLESEKKAYETAIQNLDEKLAKIDASLAMESEVQGQVRAWKELGQDEQAEQVLQESQLARMQLIAGMAEFSQELSARAVAWSLARQEMARLTAELEGAAG